MLHLIYATFIEVTYIEEDDWNEYFIGYHWFYSCNDCRFRGNRISNRKINND